MKTLSTVILIFGLISSSTFSLASPISELKDCATIKGDLKRLYCFDKKIKQINQSTEFVIESPPAIKATDASKNIEITIQQQKPKDNFGLEAKITKQTADEIHSSIKGEFKGWSGKTIFKLTNGQVWKQAGKGVLSTRKTNPTVTIKKGSMGTFRLKIGDLNSSVLVRRIK